MTPTRVPGWAAPTAVDTCVKSVRKGQEEQSGRLHLQVVPRKRVAEFSVDFEGLRLEVPTEQISQMNGVIHPRASPRQLLVGKPRPMTVGNLAVVHPVD